MPVWPAALRRGVEEMLRWAHLRPDDRDRGRLEEALADAADSRAALDQAQARFDTLLARAPIGVAFLDTEFRLLEHNDAVAELLGRPSQRLVGRTAAELVPSLWPQFGEHLRAVLATGEPRVDREVSGSLPTEPGAGRHWLVSCYPVAGASGGYDGLGVVIVEITARKRAERAATLLGRLGELFANDLDVAGTVEAAGRVVVPAFADACVLCLVDGEGEVEQLAFTARGATGDEVTVSHPDHCPVSLADDDPLGADLSAGTPVQALDIDPAQPLAGFEELAAGYGARSAIVVPLCKGDRCLGLVAFFMTEQSELRFRADDVDLAVELGVRLGQLISGVQLAEQARHAQVRLSIVARASEVVESELDVRARAEAVTRMAVPDFADHASLYLVDPELGVLRFAGGAHIDAALTRAMHAIEWPDIDLDSPTSPATAVRTNSSVLRPYQPQDGPARFLLAEHPELAEAFATRSVLSVPLRGPDGPMGALFFSYGRSRRYDEHDLTLAEELARIAAPAIHDALRYQQERVTGETLQRSLLPREIPAPAGVRVATRYLPGTTGLQVGGDWYDVVLSDRGLMLAIGDAVGHSIEAAVSMGRFRTVLQFAARQTNDPARVLRRINEFIASSFPGEMATLLVLAYDARTGEGRVASAGHLPPALRHPDGTVQLLEISPGLPVCVDARARYDVTSFQLEAGTMLVLYTDGLVERRGEVLDEGLDRLLAALGEGSDQCEVVADHLISTLIPETGTADDVALLVARVTLAGDQLRLHFPADPVNLRSVRDDVRAWLDVLGFDADQSDDVVLAVNEAVANAVEHAYADGPAGSVWVDGHVEGGEAVVVVRDEGEWRPPVPSTTRGRGLPMMRAVMDAVDVDLRVDGAEVTLRRRVPGSAVR
jgi:PAS domain S-box-containing protein